MSFEYFTVLVTVLGLAYAGLSIFLQNKLINREEMEAIRKEADKLNKETNEAEKSKDKKRIDAALKAQMDFMPKMNKMMMDSMKPAFVSLFILFGVGFLLGQIDPYPYDDRVLTLLDDGKGCDAKGGDGIFSGCLPLDNQNYGKWTITGKAFKGASESGQNSTFFLYNIGPPANTYIDGPKGQPLSIYTDKLEYNPNDTVRIFASSADATSITASMDNGTTFFIDLPFSIPLLNLQRIYHPYYWFLFISICASLSANLAMNAMKKKGGAKQVSI